MSVLLFIDKIKNKIVNKFRKAVFRKTINCEHKNFRLVGKINLLNKKIKVGNNVTLYDGVTFWGDGQIIIGDNVSIGYNTIIYASSQNGGIVIGNNTSIAGLCFIIDMDHGIESGVLIQNQENIYKKITIGSDCWIGAGAKILMGSQIKDGAVIGAQTVVKGIVPENAVFVGIPGKIRKYRCKNESL